MRPSRLALPFFACPLLALAAMACGDSDPPADREGDAGDVIDAETERDTTEDAGCDGCGTPDAGPEPTECTPRAEGDTQAFPVGAWTVSLNSATGAWSVAAPDASAPVLRGPDTCDAAGGATLRVALGEPGVENQFGAFRIALEGGDSTLEWRDVSGPPTIEAATDGVTLRYDVIDEDADVLLVFNDLDGDLRIELEGPFDAGELTWSQASDTAYFGLGSQVTSMNLRGRTFPLWTQEQGNGKPETPQIWPLENDPEAAYAPMGVWWSSAGWTALVTHDSYSEIDLGEADPALARLRSYAALPGMVLVAGATPLERMTRVTHYTGRLPYDPPAWTFGPWNHSIGGSAMLREVATTLRDADVPSSAIWSEDWIGGNQTATGYRLSYAWEWDQEQYPDLGVEVGWLHANGFAFLAYFNTFVPMPTRMWDEGTARGYLMENADGEVRTVTDPAFRVAGLVDLTNSAARRWMSDYMTIAATTLGIDGWMADFTEWAPVDVVLQSREDPWHYHNRYPLDFQATVTDVLTDVHAESDAPNNWTYFARSGWASINGGSGGLTPTMWGGDQETTWDYEDGFPTIVPIAAHLGLSGVPIFGSDIAGYSALRSPPTTKELFFRWSALGAFHPLMRTHHGSEECANWSFDRDADTLEHYRRYARLHTLLYPVFRGLSDEAREFGWPIVRHPYLVTPETPAMWFGEDFQFFIGNDIMVAPVLHEGAITRDVTFARSGWWPLFESAPITALPGPDGAFHVRRNAPATEVPVFVRPGTVLPLLDQVPDSMYGATAAGVTDLADVLGRQLLLYPATDGTLRPLRTEGTDVSGDGWAGVTNSALRETAAWNGVPLPVCANDQATNCAAADGVVIRGSGTLRAGDATLSLATDVEGRYHRVQIGGSVLATARATAIGDLNAIVTPPCEE